MSAPRTPGLAAAACLAVALLPAPAGAVAPADFAAGLELEVPGAAPVVELALPAAVYEGVQRPDLGDVRVFNGAGNAVPHGISALDPDAGQRRLHRIAAFAIDLPAAQGDRGVTVTVERDARGVIRSMRADDAGDVQTRRAYILPVTGARRPYTSIKLEWRRPTSNFVHAVALDGSDDLVTWMPLESAWLIAHLKRRSKVIRHDHLPLPAAQWKYLRIRATGDAELPDIRSALLDVGTQSLSPEVQWTEAELRPDAGKPGRYLFDVPPGMHMRSLHVIAPVDDAYARVRLLRRRLDADTNAAADDQAQWTSGSTTAVYRLAFEAGEIANKPLPVRGGPVRHWAVEVPDDGRAFDGQPPRVRIGWLAHSLVFVTRGEGPYLLAFGSATAAPVTTDARTLLREMALPTAMGADGFSLPRARAIAERTLGGEQALVVPPPPVDWKRYVLWTVLVLAVLALMWMAWRLLREPQPAGD